MGLLTNSVTLLGKVGKYKETRYFSTTTHAKRATKLVQFHSGGDDYCPLSVNEGLSDCIGQNPADGVVFAWRDDVVRKSEQGEKRLYSVMYDKENQVPVYDDSGNLVVGGEIFLKNDGSIEITGGADVVINTTGNVNIKANSVNIEAQAVNLGGEGGAFVLTENSSIVDGEGRACTITSNTTNTKAV